MTESPETPFSDPAPAETPTEAPEAPEAPEEGGDEGGGEEVADVGPGLSEFNAGHLHATISLRTLS